MSTNLDYSQVLQGSYDEATESLKVKLVDPIPVEITATTPLEVQETFDKVATASFIPFSSINANAGAWTQLIASTTAEIKIIHLFDTTGKYLQIGVGGSGSEVEECILGPGNDQPISVTIPSGSRISIRSREATAPSAGSVAINYLG